MTTYHFIEKCDEFIRLHQTCDILSIPDNALAIDQRDIGSVFPYYNSSKRSDELDLIEHEVTYPGIEGKYITAIGTSSGRDVPLDRDVMLKTETVRHRLISRISKHSALLYEHSLYNQCTDIQCTIDLPLIGGLYDAGYCSSSYRNDVDVLHTNYESDSSSGYTTHRIRKFLSNLLGPVDKEIIQSHLKVATSVIASRFNIIQSAEEITNDLIGVAGTSIDIDQCSKQAITGSRQHRSIFEYKTASGGFVFLDVFYVYDNSIRVNVYKMLSCKQYLKQRISAYNRRKVNNVVDFTDALNRILKPEAHSLRYKHVKLLPVGNTRADRKLFLKAIGELGWYNIRATIKKELAELLCSTSSAVDINYQEQELLRDILQLSYLRSPELENHMCAIFMSDTNTKDLLKPVIESKKAQAVITQSNLRKHIFKEIRKRLYGKLK